MTAEPPLWGNLLSNARDVNENWNGVIGADFVAVSMKRPGKGCRLATVRILTSS